MNESYSFKVERLYEECNEMRSYGCNEKEVNDYYEFRMNEIKEEL